MFAFRVSIYWLAVVVVFCRNIEYDFEIDLFGFMTQHLSSVYVYIVHVSQFDNITLQTR